MPIFAVHPKILLMGEKDTNSKIIYKDANKNCVVPAKTMFVEHLQTCKSFFSVSNFLQSLLPLLC